MSQSDGTAYRLSCTRCHGAWADTVHDDAWDLCPSSDTNGPCTPALAPVVPTTYGHDLRTAEGRVEAMRAASEMLREARRLTTQGDRLMQAAIQATERDFRSRV